MGRIGIREGRRGREPKGNIVGRKMVDINLGSIIVELQHYVELEDMVHMTMKVERQLKRKGTAKSYSVSFPTWKSKWGCVQVKKLAF